MAKKISTAIRELRRSNNFTLKQMAKKAGISMSYLTRLENGHVSLSEEMEGRIEAAFGDTWRRMVGSPAQEDIQPPPRRPARDLTIPHQKPVTAHSPARLRVLMLTEQQLGTDVDNIRETAKLLAFLGVPMDEIKQRIIDALTE